ncbi:MAG: hypothetical protein ACHQVS_05210 [Candidatus Babeliales bacterium]
MISRIFCAVLCLLTVYVYGSEIGRIEFEMHPDKTCYINHLSARKKCYAYRTQATEYRGGMVDKVAQDCERVSAEKAKEWYHQFEREYKIQGDTNIFVLEEKERKKIELLTSESVGLAVVAMVAAGILFDQSVNFSSMFSL